jgi:DNA end-binding protein Ku
MAAPRAYWKGYLKLSLVTCPVALYPASSQSEKTIKGKSHMAPNDNGRGIMGGLDERGAGRSQRQKHYDAWPNRSPPFDY